MSCGNNDDTSIKCTSCGESIAVDAKFCSHCGETVLDSSEGDNNDDRNNDEQCLHNWKPATCIEPKVCYECSETSGSALGHTTSTGICSRCNVRQGWTKDEVQSLIKVYSVFVDEINSAGGVDMKIAWENTSSKTIKYVYFTVEAYNAVDDKVYCEIGEHNEFTGYSTGPFKAGYTTLIYDPDDDEYYVDVYWENCYYNSNIRYFVLTNIRIIYMDNSEVEIDTDYVDYAFSDIPQGLFYSWNEEYHGYEVNYRLKDECTSKNITIPSTYNGKNVVAIANEAFCNIKTLQNIYIPDTIKSIGDNAFSNCASLSTVNFSNNIISIGDYAFSRCTNFTNITIPSNITHIGSAAFSNCTNIVKIYFNANIAGDYSFGRAIFSDSGKDGECIVTIGKNVTKIPEYLLSESKVTILEFEDSTTCTNIGQYAFSECSELLEITIPDSIKIIEDRAFYECLSIEKINFNALAMEDMNAFNYAFSKIGRNGNGIELVIDKNVTRIPSNLFYDFDSFAPNLVNVTFENGSVCKSIGDHAFYNCTYLETINIPETVTSIGTYAFYYCENLTNLYIPSSVANMGSHVFGNCENLTVYCGSAQMPSGWESNWYFRVYNIVWDCNNSD